MAASLKDKRTPITSPLYQVPSVDFTPDPPIFSLVTTFNDGFDNDSIKKTVFEKCSKCESDSEIDILKFYLLF